MRPPLPSWNLFVHYCILLVNASYVGCSHDWVPLNSIFGAQIRFIARLGPTKGMISICEDTWNYAEQHDMHVPKLMFTNALELRRAKHCCLATLDTRLCWYYMLIAVLYNHLQRHVWIPDHPIIWDFWQGCGCLQHGDGVAICIWVVYETMIQEVDMADYEDGKVECSRSSEYILDLVGGRLKRLIGANESNKVAFQSRGRRSWDDSVTRRYAFQYEPV